MRAYLAQPSTRQFMRFALVGFASLAIEYAFLGYFLYTLHLDYLVATTISFTASVAVNYVLSVRYVFEHRPGMSRGREFTIFAMLSAVGLGLNELYMFVGVGLLNVGTMAMKLISTFFVTWYNFFSRRFFLEGKRR